MQEKEIDKIILNLKNIIEIFYIEKIELMYINDENSENSEELKYIINVGDNEFEENKFAIFINKKNLSCIVEFIPTCGNLYDWEFEKISEIINKIKKYLKEKLKKGTYV